MKHIYYLLIMLFSLCGGVAFSQSPHKTKGDRYFDKYDYGRAIEYYEMAWEENPLDANVSRKMAKCFRMLSMPEMAAEWYERTLALDQSEPEDMIHLASALKRMQRYEEALLWYKKFNRINPDDSRASRHLAYRKFYEKLKEDSLLYIPKRMEINNERSALGIVKFVEDKYLVSSSGFAADDEELDAIPYLDIYVCELSEDMELINPTLMEGDVNSRYHDGPACYDPTHNALYVTRNNISKGKPVRDETGSVNLKIYVGGQIEGEFVVKEEFAFNSDNYSNGHPTVSTDGKQIIFVSNRPGGFGGTDLYICKRENDTWSEPRNMGPVINSEGDEMFPHLSPDKTLYYSSDGLVGLGGLDVFFTSFEDGKWTLPENMGYPVNSHKDDFSLIYDGGSEFGYFTSSRAGGTGGDDVFYFERAELTEKKFAVMLASTTDKLELEGGSLIIKDVRTGKERIIDYDGSEKVEFIAKPNEHLEVSYVKDGVYVFEPILLEAPVPGRIDDPYTNIGHFIYSESLEAANALAEKLDAKDWQIRLIEFTMEEDGNIPDEELIVERYHIPTTKPYNDKDWMESWDEEELAAALDNIDELYNDDFRRSTILRDLALSNIYYEYNSSNLDSTSQVTLKDLIVLLTDHPEYTLQIVAHTDAQGSNNYNITLSKQRALSAFHFMMTQGMPKKRMEMYYFGEEKLLDTSGVEELSDEEIHQLNRRAEFNILLNDTQSVNLGSN